MTNNSALKKLNETKSFKEIINNEGTNAFNLLSKIQDIGSAKTGGERIIKMSEIAQAIGKMMAGGS